MKKKKQTVADLALKQKEDLKEFRELKEMYLDKDFLDALSKNGIDSVAFANRIDEIEIGQTYKIVGYGSLLNRSDANRTFSHIKKFEVGYVEGFQRIFNMGHISTGSYLNVKNTAHKIMPIALITIGWQDMFEFYYREQRYKVIDVDVHTDIQK